MNKAFAMFFIGMLSINLLNSQTTKHISEIEERNVDGKTLIYVDDKKYDGVVFENYAIKKHFI